MGKIFINHTNHTSKQWNELQISAANAYGQIVDLPFPPIPSSASTDDVLKIVNENLQKILELSPAAVLCQGEFIYTYKIVEQLKQHNILVLAACSERIVSQDIQQDGTTRSVSIFQFVRFREY